MAVTTARSGATRRRRPRWLRFLKISFAIFFILVVTGVVSGFFIWKQALARAQSKIPSLPDIMADISKQPTVIMSADGKLLFQISAEYRKPVRIQDVPQRVIDATLAAEDRRFYDHHGVDLWAVGRQLLTNAREGRVAGGASTLTMQLAKRVYTSPEKSFKRKLDDMALAVKMEDELTKDQILELYLNQVFYGSGAFGIKAAADVYFGKPLDQLTYAEAALLARCVRRPSDENPFADLAKAIENRNIVLGVMLEERMITQEQYNHATKEKVKLRTKVKRTVLGFKTAPYFVDYVLDRLHEDLPGVDVTTGGYRIETTIDSRMQALAEKQVKELIRSHRSERVTTGAFLLCNREGQILAMVGGVDYNRNQWNATAQGRRQPGSSFKPFVYSAAFELGELSPDDSLSNERFYLRDGNGRITWEPKNSSGRYGGSVSVRTALTMSMNLPAVRVMEKVGPSTAVSFCKRVFGFSSPLEPYMSMVLGSEDVSMMEMAQGYSVFMLGGDRFKPFGIRTVTGPDGTTVLNNQPQITRGVLSQATAQTMDGLLRAVVTSGTATRARGVDNARGKTGTTSDNKDAWFIGYTDELIGVGWIANEQPNSGSGPKWRYGEMQRGVFGGTVTVLMWRAIVGEAQQMIGEKSRRISETGYARSSAPKEDTANPDVPAQDEPVADPNDSFTMPPLEPAPGGDGNPPADGAPREPTDPRGGTSPAAPPTERKPPERGGGAAPSPSPPKESGESNLIYVEVCADSGLRANSYCPERIRRGFPRGSEPRKRCPLHGP